MNLITLFYVCKLKLKMVFKVKLCIKNKNKQR